MATPLPSQFASSALAAAAGVGGGGSIRLTDEEVALVVWNYLAGMCLLRPASDRFAFHFSQSRVMNSGFVFFVSR